MATFILCLWPQKKVRGWGVLLLGEKKKAKQFVPELIFSWLGQVRTRQSQQVSL